MESGGWGEVELLPFFFSTRNSSMSSCLALLQTDEELLPFPATSSLSLSLSLSLPARIELGHGDCPRKPQLGRPGLDRTAAAVEPAAIVAGIAAQIQEEGEDVQAACPSLRDVQRHGSARRQQAGCDFQVGAVRIGS